MLSTGYLHCRWMIRRDMREVVELCKRFSVLPGDCDEDTLLHHLRQRNTIGKVVTHYVDLKNEPVVGFFMYELHKKALLVQRMAIVNESVLEASLSKLESKLSGTRRTAIYMHTGESYEFMARLQRYGYRAVKNNGRWLMKKTYADVLHS